MPGRSRARLCRVESESPCDARQIRHALLRPLGTCGQQIAQPRLDGDDVHARQVRDVLGVRPIGRQHREGVLLRELRREGDELAQPRRVGTHAGLGDEVRHVHLDVMHRPRRRGGRASIERAGRDILHAQLIERDAAMRRHAVEIRPIAGCLELAPPRFLVAEPGRPLMRPVVIPGHRDQSRYRGGPGLLIRMRCLPVLFELRQVARNLLGTLAHRGVERLELSNLGCHRIEREPMSVERGRELRMRRDHGSAERADGALLPEQRRRVQTSPRGIRPYPCADLEVDVPVRFAGPRGFVRDRDRLELLDWHHPLRAARADTRDRMLAEPDANLGDRIALRRIECIGYLGVQRRGDRQ